MDILICLYLCKHLLGIKYLLTLYTHRDGVPTQYWESAVGGEQANVYIQYQKKGEPLKSEHSATCQHITKYSRVKNSQAKLSNTDQISKMRKILPRQIALKIKIKN